MVYHSSFENEKLDCILTVRLYSNTVTYTTNMMKIYWRNSVDFLQQVDNMQTFAKIQRVDQSIDF